MPCTQSNATFCGRREAVYIERVVQETLTYINTGSQHRLTSDPATQLKDRPLNLTSILARATAFRGQKTNVRHAKVQLF